MIKFDFSADKEFIGIDGKERKGKKIEDWFVSNVKNKISANIDNRIKSINTILIQKSNLRAEYYEVLKNEFIFLKSLHSSLEYYLRASPEELEKIKDRDSKLLKKMGIIYTYRIEKKNPNNIEKVKFFDLLLKIFDYDTFRASVLPQISMRLNIKSCPYCNQQFTLNIRKEWTNKKKNRIYNKDLAKLQFDHYYNRSSYPFLSMSLYNLIPSCAVCNQLKSNIEFPLIFHPFYFKERPRIQFKLNHPLPLFSGALPDEISVSMAIDDKRYTAVFDYFINVLKLKERYGRHRDIIEEIFAREYLKPYYENSRNFSGWIMNKREGDPRTIENELYERIISGNYPNEVDFYRRPLAKFMHDIRENL